MILEGDRIRLETLTLAHLDGYVDAALADKELFTLMPEPPRSREAHIELFHLHLEAQAAGTRIPFAQIDKATGRIVGGTVMYQIVPEHRRLEIGHTWITPEFQRTYVNTEAKYLLLRHAFETMKCIRVELKTDVLNERSRKAMLRIGLKEEGTFRSHMITAGGRVRDTVYYSVIESEWPAVKAHLERLMRR